MDLLDIMLCVAIAFVVLTNLWEFLSFTNELGASPKKCPPHEWAPNADNKLQCKKPGCGYIAGSDHIPRGDENA